MSYLEFHLVFILPPIAVLLALQPGLWRRAERYRLGWIGVVALIALFYTTPWDNYLVWHSVWAYGSERVLGSIGYVPIEEYAFFLLQTSMTGLWTLWLLPRVRSASGVRNPVAVRIAGVFCYGAMAVVGFVLLRFDRSLYLGLIASWAGLALMGQWAVAGQTLWKRRRLIVTGVAAPTGYLWLADWIAIRDGIWTISPTYTTGLNIAGLPIEEALFFLVTNLLVVQGLVLFLPRRAYAPLKRATRPPIQNPLTDGVWE